MSKVTDRLDNKQLIELAKKQYETSKKTSKYPGHVVKLPSAGKVYPKTSALSDGIVELRLMTAYDEDILTNSSYISEGILFNKLLESLIITPGVDVNELITTDKESLVISARILGYGSEYNTSYTIDGETKDHVIDLSALKFKSFDLESDDNGEFTYNVQTTGDVIKYKYLSEKQASKISDSNLVTGFLKQTITEINGNRDSEQILNFLEYEFRALESKKFRTFIIENTPGLDYTVEIEGEDGGTFTVGFRVGANLFWF